MFGSNHSAMPPLYDVSSYSNAFFFHSFSYFLDVEKERLTSIIMTYIILCRVLLLFNHFLSPKELQVSDSRLLTIVKLILSGTVLARQTKVIENALLGINEHCTEDLSKPGPHCSATSLHIRIRSLCTCAESHSPSEDNHNITYV